MQHIRLILADVQQCRITSTNRIKKFFLQTIQERHKALLQKAQEELEGNTSNKLSLKATLTDQIKEQENNLAAVKEVKSDRLVLFKQNLLEN